MLVSEMRKIKRILLAAFLSLIISGFSVVVYGENHVDVSLGAGLSEFINIGLRYQAAQMQVGLSYGFLPLEDETCTSIAGDIYFHFAGRSAFFTRKPWYSKFGISYVQHKQDDKTSSYIYSNFRIGREFFISKKIGIGADLGMSFELSKEIKKEHATPGWLNLDFDFPILPCFGINIFYHYDFLPRYKRGAHK
ncbi:MAG: hypothetical protein RAP70_05485 [Candidatus Celaenobacter antarcticus]|nr:hypothetical protein [Candidatus Celaenobacter antarcticus]